MDSKTKIKIFFTSELVVWLLIIFVTIFSIRFYFANKQNSLPTYRIFMQDVDGLIEGSAVRLMGVPIGYVKNIYIVQDHVYVKFVLTNKDITLPKGIIATVEFNGMAGSKSLELYPPDNVSRASGNLVTIKRTSRLGAALGLFDDMFAKFDSILVRCNYFSEQLDTIMPKSEHQTSFDTNTAEDSLKALNYKVNDIDKQRTGLFGKLKSLKIKSQEIKEDQE